MKPTYGRLAKTTSEMAAGISAAAAAAMRRILVETPAVKCDASAAEESSTSTWTMWKFPPRCRTMNCSRWRKRSTNFPADPRAANREVVFRRLDPEQAAKQMGVSINAC